MEVVSVLDASMALVSAHEKLERHRWNHYTLKDAGQGICVPTVPASVGHGCN